MLPNLSSPTANAISAWKNFLTTQSKVQRIVLTQYSPKRASGSRMSWLAKPMTFQVVEGGEQLLPRVGVTAKVGRGIGAFSAALMPQGARCRRQRASKDAPAGAEFAPPGASFEALASQERLRTRGWLGGRAFSAPSSIFTARWAPHSVQLSNSVPPSWRSWRHRPSRPPFLVSGLFSCLSIFGFSDLSLSKRGLAPFQDRGWASLFRRLSAFRPTPPAEEPHSREKQNHGVPGRKARGG